MVYQSGFVVCLLTHGKVVHESNGLCELNEGDEYTVRLRNKTYRRAACELFIDGELQGNYVVNAKSHVDVQRSVAKNAAFKFTHIDSGESIDQGKNSLSLDSGKIRALFRFEKYQYHNYQPIYIQESPQQPYITPYTPWKYPSDYGYPTIIKGGNPNITQTFNTVQSRGFSCNASLNTLRSAENNLRANVGVTVDGGKTYQSFYTTYFPTEYNYAAVIELRLKLRNIENENVLSKGKNMYCGQCGATRESARARFCVNCGHKLKA